MKKKRGLIEKMHIHAKQCICYGIFSSDKEVIQYLNEKVMKYYQYRYLYFINRYCLEMESMVE